VTLLGYGQSKAWKEDVPSEDVALQIIKGLNVEKAVLMGKSWGGGVVIKTALKYPRYVSKLVLQAPAFKEKRQLSQLEQAVLLCWAEDDPTIAFSRTQVYKEAVKNLQLVTYPSGGHSAAMENSARFLPHLLEFLQK